MPHKLADVLAEAIRDLSASDTDTPRLDARVLIAHVLAREPNELITASDIAVQDSQADRIASMVERRRAGEPVSRILGRREFWSLSFVVTPDTLDPRPESETLVDACVSTLSDYGKTPVRILDAGTGTGSLLLSLLTEWPEARGVGVDISERALSVASENAKRLGLENRCAFICSHWLTAVAGAYDLIVTNPPYIGHAEVKDLSPSVVDYDPPIALFAGEDGLDGYRKLIPQCADALAPQGLVVVEIGAGQAGAVRDILTASGFRNIQIHADLAGTERCLTAGKI